MYFEFKVDDRTLFFQSIKQSLIAVIIDKLSNNNVNQV